MRNIWWNTLYIPNQTRVKINHTAIDMLKANSVSVMGRLLLRRLDSPGKFSAIVCKEDNFMSKFKNI